jgi:hypothetical protein
MTRKEAESDLDWLVPPMAANRIQEVFEIAAGRLAQATMRLSDRAAAEGYRGSGESERQGGGEASVGDRNVVNIELLRVLTDLKQATTEQTEVLARTLSLGTQGVLQKVVDQTTNISRTVPSGIGALGISGGLGMLISGLFRKTSNNDVPIIDAERYWKPQPVRIESDVNETSGPEPGVSYGQFGLPRVDSRRQGANTEITININALDARSLLDRSNDIANAVRAAVLGGHGLNDVVAEL